jgi:hypothetical protein
MSTRILLVGYETESIALADMADQMSNSSYEFKLALGDYYNFIDDNSIRTQIKETGFTNWTSYEEPYKKIYSAEWQVDWEYLQQFESTYCKNKNLIQLLRTDQILLRDHHFRRPYYKPESPESDFVYYWAEQQLRWIEDIFETFEPDIIFTIGRNYFIKNAIAQIALSTNTDIRTLVRSRVGKYHHMTHNFGYGTDEKIQQYLQQPVKEAKLHDAEQLSEEFCRSDEFTSLYDAQAQQLVEQKQLVSFEEILQGPISKTIQLLKKTIQRSKTKYRGALRANYFNSHFPSAIRLELRISYNKLKYLITDIFNQSLPDSKYIYLPLHTLPESATLTLSTNYYESDLIRFISNRLPAGVLLVVKENPNMVGLRPFEYYKNISELPNVHLLDPKISSKKVIQNSRGVTGVSGTALLEAAVLGKITHAFGHPEFEAVVDYHGYEEITQFVDQCMTDTASQRSREVLKYIQFVINNGRKLLLDPINTSPRTEAYWQNLEIIQEMFRNEVNQIEKNMVSTK